MIPKVIHTCWFTKNSNSPLPRKVQDCIDSWRRNCPEFEIRVWKIEDWDFRSHTYSKQCWEAGVASYAYLSNYFRFWVLYNYGGVYLEADMKLTRNIEDMCDFDSDDAYLCLVNPEELSGCAIVSSERHPLMRHFVENVFSENRQWIKKNNSLNIYHDTGEIGEEVKRFLRDQLPNINTTIEPVRYPEKNVVVLPKNYLLPASFSDGIYGYHVGSLSHYRKISVVMPVWNSEKYLSEAIDSVLSQDFTDFELLCIDDGSTDSSAQIIKSYFDDRVVYISKEHSGIVDSLNIGINRAIGEYIVRFDSDDIMLPGRLRHQLEYMQTHPHIDILGSGFQWGNGKEIPEYFRCPERILNINCFRCGNVIAHPATIIKKSALSRLPYIYESYYDGCEDFKLWLHSIHHGLTVATEPTPVIIYRQHADQVTNSSEYYDKSFALVEKAKRTYYYKDHLKDANPELTCIIPFQNEGTEVERTVANIRATAGENVNIILIDDCSLDHYDYKWVADKYDCDFYKNETNLGVAGSRNFGVDKCKTPYFVLLDAHMRFYEDNWHLELLKNLKENPNCLVSSNTVIFGYDKNTEIYGNEGGLHGRDHFGTYGAIVNLEEPGWEFTAKWTGKLIPEYENEDLVPIPCCLGAVYAASKVDWIRLGGLKGLIKYGLDEPLISLKYWLSGGKILLMKNWGVGHLYRGSSPYSIPIKHIDYNQLYLIHLFSESEEDIKKYEKGLYERIGKSRFSDAMAVLDKQRKELDEFKTYWNTELKRKSLSWFIDNINNKAN